MGRQIEFKHEDVSIKTLSRYDVTFMSVSLRRLYHPPFGLTIVPLPKDAPLTDGLMLAHDFCYECSYERMALVLAEFGADERAALVTWARCGGLPYAVDVYLRPAQHEPASEDTDMVCGVGCLV